MLTKAAITQVSRYNMVKRLLAIVIVAALFITLINLQQSSQIIDLASNRSLLEVTVCNVYTKNPKYPGVRI